MIIQEYYDEAVEYKHYSLQLWIEYLVNERRVLKMTDSEEQLRYYLQDRFTNKMNQYIAEYEQRRK